jgi:AcrR family transcriptional regulator
VARSRCGRGGEYLLRPLRTDDHGAVDLEQILNAARRCFVREGFHTTTMADVIAESGLSVGAVYRYFPGKEDLIRAAVQGSIERVAEIDQAAPWDLLPDLSDVPAGSWTGSKRSVRRPASTSPRWR